MCQRIFISSHDRITGHVTSRQAVEGICLPSTLYFKSNQIERHASQDARPGNSYNVFLSKNILLYKGSFKIHSTS